MKFGGFHLKSAGFHECELLGDHQVQVFLSKDQQIDHIVNKQGATDLTRRLKEVSPKTFRKR